MSQKQKVFTRKQLLVIFKIAFLEAMALSLIIPTISSTGEITSSCPSFPSSPCLTQVQVGFGSCSPLVGSNNCIFNAVFSPAYSSIPTFIPWLNGTAPSPVYTFPSGLVMQYQVFPQATNASAWFNMPTKDLPIELYNTTNNRVQIDSPFGTVTSFYTQLCVTIIQPSQNTTATLGVQVGSTNIGDANYLVNIGSVSNGLRCGTAEISAPPIATGQLQTLRVVGRDGAGDFFCAPTCSAGCSKNNVGAIGTFRDCPQFGTIEIMYGYALQYANTCFLSVFSVTTIQGRIQITCEQPNASSVTFKFNWKAGILG